MKSHLKNKANATLPKDKAQAAEIVGELVSDMTPTKRDIVFSKASRVSNPPGLGRHNILNQEKRDFLLAFLVREDISYYLRTIHRSHFENLFDCEKLDLYINWIST